MNTRNLMLGNEAISRGLIENGCAMATSYPGTPASEILSSLAIWQKKTAVPMHIQWAVNEKVAFEIAYAGSMTGLRTAVSMKQVGLNVAADPLMSAAYMGTKGGFIVVSADDPGPHSSQTEQDSRQLAMMAKIPVLDPDSPASARDMVALAYALSESFATPVMLRPVTRVCHARQDVSLKAPVADRPQAQFDRDPGRWAATPKFRLQLHRKLEKKIAAIAAHGPTYPVRRNPRIASDKALIVSGVAAAHALEILESESLGGAFAVYQVLQPYPLHTAFVAHLMDQYREILVLEETTGVIEMQLADRQRVRGKISGFVPAVGELDPETIEQVVCRFSGVSHSPRRVPLEAGRRPTLCAGCPHRASFFAIRKAAPRGIYTSDIGCYTLGLNLGAVDTVLCMGAAISQAAGFFHAFKNSPRRRPIIATMGDSTFFHAGVPALIDAVVQKVGFVLVILDNRTTAMTGSQPTPASGIGARGEPLGRVDIEALVRGCGITYCRKADPYQLDEFISLVKSAVAYSEDSGPAVVIAEHPCLLDKSLDHSTRRSTRVTVTDDCDGCGFCAARFECPAMVSDPEGGKVHVDRALCSDCGVCLDICPQDSIVEQRGGIALIRQQIIISGVGGQGILFVTRLLAEAAIENGISVLTSETHGMAQRGGTVISHLKVGGFSSPLIRSGRADFLLALKAENVTQHSHYLHLSGQMVVNGALPAGAEVRGAAFVLDADAAAARLENPRSVNLLVLGCALAAFGREKQGGSRLFCTMDDIRGVVQKRFKGRDHLLQAALRALEAGFDQVK